jgi:dolichol-phosphate mannosyltransferase
MNQQIDLTVILPAYKEEENLRELLPRLLLVLGELNINSEILVVDTQQKLDDTLFVCQSLGVRHLQRIGGDTFGAAVRTGIAQALGEKIIFMDADGSHAPEFIPQLLNNLKDNDVVIASRYVENGDTENSMSLILMSRVVNWTFSFVLGLKCKDVSNSFKLYRASQLKNLNLKCENFDIVEEILFKIKRENPEVKFKEIPFVFKKRMYGETKRNLLIFVITYLITIIKLRFRP